LKRLYWMGEEDIISWQDLLCVALEYGDRMNWLTKIPQSKCRVSGWCDNKALCRVGWSVGQFLVVTCEDSTDLRYLGCKLIVGSSSKELLHFHVKHHIFRVIHA
jgi:hypothetical protein